MITAHEGHYTKHNSGLLYQAITALLHNRLSVENNMGGQCLKNHAETGERLRC